MKDHRIDFDSPSVMINGKVYPILQSDVDVMESALEIQNMAVSLDRSSPEAIVKAVISIREWADKTLGRDALVKIADGKPIGIVQAMGVVSAVMEAVSETYETRVLSDYGLLAEQDGDGELPDHD